MAEVRVEGLREAVTAMRRAGVETSDLKEGFSRIGRDVVSYAKRIAPVGPERKNRKPGKLRNNIRASRRVNGVIVSAGGALVPYASFVYWGSVHNPRPVPFIAMALDYVDVERGVQDAVNEALRRAGW